MNIPHKFTVRHIFSHMWQTDVLVGVLTVAAGVVSVVNGDGDGLAAGWCYGVAIGYGLLSVTKGIVKFQVQKLASSIGPFNPGQTEEERKAARLALVEQMKKLTAEAEALTARANAPKRPDNDEDPSYPGGMYL